MLGLAVALVLLSSCDSQTPSTIRSISSTGTTDQGSKAPSVIHLTEKDDGRTLEIAAGGTMEIALKANPSTGHFWELEDLDAEASLIEQVGDPAFVSDDPGTPGAGGVLTFSFRAVDRGEMIVRLVYLPPSGDKPSRSFELDLVVK